MKATAGIFPLLDAETAQVVLSYLPSGCLGDSTLVSKAWEAVSSKDDLWRPFLSRVDPMSALGEDRLHAMSLQYSCKQVVSELSTRLCSCCREPTNGFFVLTCTRVCLSCFETEPSVRMSSLSFARNHYLLSKSQETSLPTMRVENADVPGCGPTHDSAMTLTLISAASASAVIRWGSQEGFEDEKRTRKARAEAAYEARKKAFNDQAAPGSSTMESPGSLAPSRESSGQRQTSEKPRRFPSRPRILKLEANWVGDSQQKHHGLRSEKYGFYTVVNDAYFDGGPTVVITTGYQPNFCHVDCMTIEENEETERASEVRHGRKLVEALKTAKHGTTIEIAADCCAPTTGLTMDTSVRLVGDHNHHVRTWMGPLVVGAPSIVRNLEARHELPPMSEDEMHDYPADDGCGTSVILLDDAVVENCSIGQYNASGVCLFVQMGRLVANGNTFFLGGLSGIAVTPVAESVATTVQLERNTFSDSDCGLQKGPASCHVIQEDSATLAANTFRRMNEKARVRQQHRDG